MKRHVVIGLGSNLGDKSKNLHQAIFEIEKSIGTVERISSFIETTAWGFDSEHTFLNACLLCSTTFTPLDLLLALKTIEQQMGRQKTKNTYEDRCIDLDIIFYEDEQIQSEQLTIPHPHFRAREFVMLPLVEILHEKDVFFQFLPR